VAQPIRDIRGSQHWAKHSGKYKLGGAALAGGALYGALRGRPNTNVYVNPQQPQVIQRGWEDYNSTFAAKGFEIETKMAYGRPGAMSRNPDFSRIYSRAGKSGANDWATASARSTGNQIYYGQRGFNDFDSMVQKGLWDGIKRSAGRVFGGGAKPRPKPTKAMNASMPTWQGNMPQVSAPPPSYTSQVGMGNAPVRNGFAGNWGMTPNQFAGLRQPKLKFAPLPTKKVNVKQGQQAETVQARKRGRLF